MIEANKFFNQIDARKVSFVLLNIYYFLDGLTHIKVSAVFSELRFVNLSQRQHVVHTIAKQFS